MINFRIAPESGEELLIISARWREKTRLNPATVGAIRIRWSTRAALPLRSAVMRFPRGGDSSTS